MTAIFSEWVKGPAGLPSTNGLGMVYKSGIPMANFPTDYQFAQYCHDHPNHRQSELGLEG